MKFHSLLRSVLILLCLLLCIVLTLSLWALFQLPEQARQTFGPPANDLSKTNTIFLSLKLSMQENELTSPFNPIGIEQSFQIKSGEATHLILDHLYSQGLIPNTSTLRDYLVYSGLDKSLQAGNFTLSPRMTPLEIVYILQDSSSQEITFVILAGWRREEIAAAIAASGFSFSLSDFLTFTSQVPSASPLATIIPANTSLEGFLFPENYQVPRRIELATFVNLLLDNFLLKIPSEFQNAFNQNGLDTYQAVTLASIVQREAMLKEEMPAIASVFYNRLDAGMKLDSDPTVQYALGYISTGHTWWKNPLSLDDLSIESFYNTYLYPNLPPGPISNPGFAALQAVAYPSSSPYYYFRAACDGSLRHVFARTLAEHIANACK